MSKKKTEKVKSVGKSIKRLPGQALREERDKILERMFDDPCTLMFAGWVILVIELMHVYGKLAPNIWFGIVPMVVLTAYCLRKVVLGRRMLRNYRRGEEGERIVAQAIEHDLIPLGYTVFHDIPFEKDGRRFNIDHLLIGSNGIFAIETKNYVKPAKGAPEVRYDGTTILWNGMRHTKCDEIAQARAAAVSAKELIDDLTGFNVYVHPVLCAVGWFVKSTDLYGHPVLLVMEKVLKSVIPNVKAKKELSEADRNKIIAALKRNA